MDPDPSPAPPALSDGSLALRPTAPDGARYRLQVDVEGRPAGEVASEGNTASAAVAIRAGFTATGRDRAAFTLADRLVDDLRFDLVAKDLATQDPADDATAARR